MKKVDMSNWYPKDYEPQGQYLDGMSEENIRKTFLQIGRCCLGMVRPTKSYLNLLYPFDEFSKQSMMAKSQQGCSLTMAGIMRCAGCMHPELLGEYWSRNDAHSRLEVVARDYEAWGGHDGEFQPGDIIMIGTDVALSTFERSKIIAAWGTPGHACMVAEMDGDNIVTIDGGRGPITRTARTVTKDAQNRVWVTGSIGTRRVWGSIRVGKLKFDPDVQWCLPKNVPNYPGT